MDTGIRGRQALRDAQAAPWGAGAGPEPFWLLDPFDGLADEESAALERAFPARRWTPGDPVPSGGGAELVIVRGGLVAVMSPTTRGRAVAVALLQAGDLYMVNNPLDATCRLEALEPAWISAVSTDRLELLLERAPAIASHLVHGLAHQLEEAARAAGILSEMRVEDRLMGTFVRLAMRHAIVTSEGVQLSLELSHAQWGTLVGASREAVTAALIRLRHRGWLRSRGRVIVLPQAQVFGEAGARAEDPATLSVAAAAAA